MDIRDGKILIIEDERPLLEYLAMALTTRGCPVLPFDNGDKALTAFFSMRCDGMQPAVVVVDTKLVGSEVTALDIARKIHDSDPECIIIFMSVPELAQEVKLSAGSTIDRFMMKPITGEELMAEIRTAKEARQRLKPGSPQGQISNASRQRGFSTFENREMAVYALNLLFVVLVIGFLGVLTGCVISIRDEVLMLKAQQITIDKAVSRMQGEADAERGKK